MISIRHSSHILTGGILKKCESVIHAFGLRQRIKHHAIAERLSRRYPNQRGSNRVESLAATAFEGSHGYAGFSSKAGTINGPSRKGIRTRRSGKGFPHNLVRFSQAGPRKTTFARNSTRSMPTSSKAVAVSTVFPKTLLAGAGSTIVTVGSVVSVLARVIRAEAEKVLPEVSMARTEIV